MTFNISWRAELSKDVLSKNFPEFHAHLIEPIETTWGGGGQSSVIILSCLVGYSRVDAPDHSLYKDFMLI
jgi:hypothetical protein